MPIEPSIECPSNPPSNASSGDPSAAADDDDDTEANAEAATSSKQDEAERPSLFDGIRACAKKPTVPLLVLAGGVVSGAYTSWATLLPVMVQGLGESVVCNGTVCACTCATHVPAFIFERACAGPSDTPGSPGRPSDA